MAESKFKLSGAIFSPHPKESFCHCASSALYAAIYILPLVPKETEATWHESIAVDKNSNYLAAYYMVYVWYTCIVYMMSM